MEPALVSTQAIAPPELQLKDCVSWLSWKHPDSARCCDPGPASTTAQSCSSSSCRLQDCLEVLENMDKEGTLNMRKIKHVKFYNACKKHRAVKEAFRFTQLIKKPSMSTYNQLLSVCAKAKDIQGAFEVLDTLEKAGLKADCILYTTLISACAKAGKVDSIFQVFHEMVNKGVEPNVHTYGALIDGCARIGQVGKAFGVYGIMRSKKLKPDQVIFNSLITACGRSGALERAFDVFSEMTAEPIPVEPNHVTIGALIKACTRAGRVDRAMEVYAMMGERQIQGSVEVYTEAVHACSINGDLDTALAIYKDLKDTLIQPDEVFFSALIDVAGHAGKLDCCFDFLKEMKQLKLNVGTIVYSSIMGACSNTGNWEKALHVYREMQTTSLSPTISTMNALLTALCGGGQLQEAKRILQEMRHADIALNAITYTILFGACEQAGDIDFSFDLHKSATSEGIVPTVEMCESIIGLCLQHIWKLSGGPTPTSSLGTMESISFCGRCSSWALSVYRKAVASGIVPTMKMLSQLLGCLRLPRTVDDNVLYNYVFAQHSSHKQLSLIDGFGVYDPRALALFEEAAALGIVPTFSYTGGPITIDTSIMPVFLAEVCILTVLKGFKHRLAAGARIPAVTIILAATDTELVTPDSGQKKVPLMSRTSQAVAGLLRRLRLKFHGYESSGKLKVTVQAIKHWLQPRPDKFPLLQLSSGSHPSSIAKKITEQQRMLRYVESSMWSTLSSQKCNNKDAAQHMPLHSSHPPPNNKDAHMHLPVSNGVHVLESVKPDEMIRIPSAKEEILST